MALKSTITSAAHYNSNLNVTASRYLALLLTVLFAAGAYAQQYPSKPVRFISPYPAGGGNDTLLRIL
ncbi:MAG: hypothetical protein JWO68_4258, partial [Actinomycetia bacterium]|nr:hypothetical protein [Actinomycetes bacterium]